MTPAPHSVGREQTLGVAHQLMREHGLRHLPVLEGGKLVGMLSQRDLYFLETLQGVDVERDRVEEAMSQDVYCVPPDTGVEAVIVEMADHRYGCAVVVIGPMVVGVFTTTDALELLAALLKQRASP